MWQRCLCGDDAVLRRGLDRSVIGLFGLGVSSCTNLRVVVQWAQSCWLTQSHTRLQSRLIFHSSIIHRPRARGVFFFFWNEPWFIFSETPSLCANVVFHLVDVGDTCHVFIDWMSRRWRLATLGALEMLHLVEIVLILWMCGPWWSLTCSIMGLLNWSDLSKLNNRCV